jgi:hypothetical protein
MEGSMKKTKIRKVLAAVSVVSVAGGLVLAAGCKSSCGAGSCGGKGSCSGGKGTTTQQQPKSSCSGAK